jgi:exopolyphosphatase / guanosine-5'-triphosphate,3'-diphosphate pyrophosphatase
MSSKRIAAIDVGSLTVRLAVAERVGPGCFRVLRQLREITGLGRGLARTGSLAPEGMDRTLAALQGFLREVAGLGVGVQEVEAVGTEALRQANNGQAFLERVRAELGLTVRVLAPQEEARLSLIGVLTVLAPEYLQEPALAVFDVGGGSTELALVRSGGEPFFGSLPLGVLTLSQAFPLGDPPEAHRVSALKQEVAARLTRFHEEFVQPRLEAPPRLVGTAGAVTTLAAMALKMTAYDPNRINNLVLTREQIAALAELLAGLTEAERARLPGLEPGKAGVMVAGAVMVLTLLQVFSRDSLVVIDAGLLEGILSQMSSRI